MRPQKPPNGKCPSDSDRDSCPLTCKYNHFESEELTIDAWELKCHDCGWRDTIGFRSDEEEDDEDAADSIPDDPTRCPFCDQANLAPGKEPCQQGSGPTC